MSEQQAEVKLGADIAQFKAGMGAATDAISDFAAGLKDSLKTFGDTSKQTTSQVIADNQKMSQSFGHLKDSAKEGFHGITEGIEKFHGSLIALTAVLAGGLFGKEAVSEVLKLEDSVRSLEIRFGMTAEAATLLSTQLTLAGISTSEYEGMAMRVMRVLKNQSEEFDRLKVTTKDASGALLPMDEILQNVYKRMQDFKAGTDQAEFALSTVGRNAGAFASDMERMNRTAERAKQLMEELGIEMGPERQAQVEAYRLEFNAFKLAIEELYVKIGESMLPRLIAMSSWMSSQGPAAIHIVEGALQGLATGMTYFIGIITTWGQLIGTVLAGIANSFVDMARVANAALRFDFGGAVSATKNYFGGLKLTADESMRLLLDNAKKTASGIASIWGEHTLPAGGKSVIPGSGKEGFTPKPTGGSGGGKEKVMQEWTGELEALKEFIGEEDSYLKSTLAVELKYWKDKLSIISGNGDAEKELRRQVHTKIFALEKQSATQDQAAYMATAQYQLAQLKNDSEAKIALMRVTAAEVARVHGAESPQAIAEMRKVEDAERAHAEELKKIQIDTLKSAMEHQVRMLELEKTGVQNRFALEQISSAQKLAMEKDIDDRIYELKIEAQKKTIALLDGDKKALAEAKDAELKIIDDHLKQVQKAEDEAAKERKKAWDEMFAPLERAFSLSIQGIITGTTTLKKAMQNIFTSILSSFADLALHIGLMWAKAMLANTNVGQAFLTWYMGMKASIAASEAAAAVSSAASAKVKATAVIPAEAAEAAGGAAAAVAGIPIIGPELAAVAYAETLAMVMSGMGLASFAVGTSYVPHDMVAQVHRGERIVTAADNEAGKYGGNTTIQLNVSAVDGASVKKLFMDHGPALSAALRRQARNFTSTVPA